LQKQIRVALRPQHAHDFIGLSFNFLLQRAQTVALKPFARRDFQTGL
jgi:hypothetical protein